MDQADIGFSAFYAWPSSFKVVDFPASHMRSSVTMVTPQPKLLPGWMVPLAPFSSTMWGAVGACLVGSTYILYNLQRFVDKYLGNSQDKVNPFSKMDYTALRTYAMLVNQAPTFSWNSNVPRHVPARHFVAWFQFLGEVISDTYNAGLASVLSSPRYEPPIETIEDLANRDVIWAGNHVAWIWSIEEDDNPNLQTITENFRCLTNEQMNEIGQRSGDLAFGIERLQGGHFTTEPHINGGTVKHRRIMRGTLYWSHLYILLRKGSPYMRHFRTLVSRQPSSRGTKYPSCV
ncbi:glutamate receptor 2-like isoform X2 [Zootermopsis nevadensis]|uniref:glutamate receptor 2-like isoform X2 n=1 Tax=Zootermopsis nevadensis TaxID=136037 RepID=UPI000B8E932A|nr:glutamate receptor 2-like isoform X2 [Zootermopsis nevadensis]